MRDIDIVVYSDDGLRFAIDLDTDSEKIGVLGTSSIYLSISNIQIRQFATRDQLIRLRDQLLQVFPLTPTTKTVEVRLLSPLLHPEDLKE